MQSTPKTFQNHGDSPDMTQHILDLVDQFVGIDPDPVLREGAAPA
jgi:hypothetical protein